MSAVAANSQNIELQRPRFKRNLRVGMRKVKRLTSKLLSAAMIAYEDGDRIHRRIQAQKQEIQQRYMRDLFPRF